jgi:hypothetical protein
MHIYQNVQVSTFILWSSIFLVLAVISTVFTLIPSLYWQPVGYYTIWFCIYFTVTTRALFQVLAVHPHFQPPLSQSAETFSISSPGKTTILDNTPPPSNKRMLLKHCERTCLNHIDPVFG